jgi:hypothetical protein
MRSVKNNSKTAKIKELEAKLRTATATGEPKSGSLKDQAFCAQQAEEHFNQISMAEIRAALSSFKRTSRVITSPAPTGVLLRLTVTTFQKTAP